MINSLFKDSHITQPLWHSQKMYSGSGLGRGASPNERQSAGKEYSSVSVNNNIGTSVNKPAKLSFRGLSDIHLAKGELFKGFINKVETFIGKSITNKDKSQTKAIRTFVEDVVDFVTGARSDVADNVKTFATENNDDVQSILEKSKKLITTEHEKKPLKEDILKKTINKTIGSAVDVLHTVNKEKSIYKKSNLLKKVIESADTYQVFFSAGFALILTGLFRPATIMALPGQKKNKDDKKYAAAQSISSGLIGFIVAFLVSTPLSKAIEKFTDGISCKKMKDENETLPIGDKDENGYIYEKDKNGNFVKDKNGNNKIKRANVYLDSKKENHGFFFLDEEAIKEELNEKLKNAKSEEEIKKLRKEADKRINTFKTRSATAKNYLNQSVDILMAAPKAMITIALLPIVLKYVFGLQKKKGNDKNMQPQQIQNYTALNFKSSNNNDRKVFKEFNGGVR